MLNRKSVRIALTIVFVLVAAAVGLSLAAWRLEPWLRARIVSALGQRFDARVELDSFHVSALHGLEAEGRGLAVWPQQSQATAPLIYVDRFRFRAPLRWSRTLQIADVELDGMRLTLPPHAHFVHPASAASPAAAPLPLRFVLNRLHCADLLLTLQTDKPGREPMQFRIHSLTLTGLSSSAPMHVAATLTIPRPAGEVSVVASFGPWTSADPGEAPLLGSYILSHAQLQSFRGIRGQLSSSGRFQGTLRALAVQGSTSTPDFALTHFGQTLPLSTHFDALVDATTGDTHLNRVDAQLAHSRFSTSGDVLRLHGRHQLSFAVQIPAGRIEDFLRLLNRPGSDPLLSGGLALSANLRIPPGDLPVHRRLQLDGHFQIVDALFAHGNIQRPIAQLSLRGLGHPEAIASTDPQSIRAVLAGDFFLADALLHLPQLDFAVPGAHVAVRGNYALDSEALNFNGTADLNARASEMVTGWKSLLLRPADRLFGRQGTHLLFTVTGSRSNPAVHLDVAGFDLRLPAHRH